MRLKSLFETMYKVLFIPHLICIYGKRYSKILMSYAFTGSVLSTTIKMDKYVSVLLILFKIMRTCSILVELKCKTFH